MKISDNVRFLTGAFCMVAGVGIAGAGFMHAGDMMDAPYKQHLDSGMVKVELGKVTPELEKVRACEQNLSAGKGCDAESVQLMMMKKANENTVSDIFTRIVPLGMLFTLAGMALWPSKKENSDNKNDNTPDVPFNPGMTM